MGFVYDEEKTQKFYECGAGNISLYKGINLVPLHVERVPIFQTTRSVKGNKMPYYVNAYTTEGSFSLRCVINDDEPYQVIPCRGKEMMGVKFMYDKEVDGVALIFCSIDTSEICTSRKVREWHEEYRSYVLSDKRCLTNHVSGFNRATWRWFSTEDRFAYQQFSLSFLYSINGASGTVIIDSTGLVEDTSGKNTAWEQYDAMEPFRKMWGDVVPIQGNRMIALDTIYAVNGFARYTQPKGSGSEKKNKKLEKLLSFPLPDHHEPESLPEIKTNFGYEGKHLSPLFENVQKYAVIQRVEGAEEPTCVIRSFFKHPKLGVTKEGGRIYITKKEVIPSKVTIEGTYMYQTLLNTPVHWSFYIEDFDSKITEGTMLEYYGKIIGDIEPQYRGVAIWSFIKWPFTESMYKIDTFRPFMKEVFKRAVLKSPIEILENCFGKLDTKASNVYKIIGMNRAQTEVILPYMVKYMPLINISGGYLYTHGPIAYIKMMLSGVSLTYDNTSCFCTYRDISSIDIECVKFVTNAVVGYLSKIPKEKEFDALIQKMFIDWKDASKIRNAMERIHNISFEAAFAVGVYGIGIIKKVLPVIISFGEDWERTICRNTEFRRYYFNVFTLFRDYLQMVEELQMQSQLKPYFKSVDELIGMHDTLSELYNSKKSEVEMRKWTKRAEDKNWKKWEYEDGVFKVVAPVKPDELATEGITLKHCVKSYIGRVSNGSTNIMFIRRAEYPDVPFFTVEVDNENVIQQVHGACNCSSDTVSGLPEFVKKWAKERGLKVGFINQVR